MKNTMKDATTYAFKNLMEEYANTHTQVGTSVFLSLDTDRIVEVCFNNHDGSGKYRHVALAVIHKRNGIIHEHEVALADIFQDPKDKYIQCRNGSYDWKREITEEDSIAMKKTIRDYISLWT